MSAAYGGTGQALQYEDSALFTFTTKTTEALDLNLLSDKGTGFDSLEAHSGLRHDYPPTYTFSTLASADLFFSNHSLPLGSFASGSETMSLEYFLTYNSGTKAAAGAGFGFAYDITDPAPAVSSPAVPETSTWAMMLVGLAGLAWVGSRRSCKANA